MRKSLYGTAAAVLVFALAMGSAVAGTSSDVATDGGKGDVQFTSSRAGVGSASERALVNRASTLLKVARLTDDADLRELNLTRVLQMDLPAGDRRVRKILYTAHVEMAAMFDHAPAKKAHHLVLAGQYIDNAMLLDRLQEQVAELGGDTIGFRPSVPAAKTVGVADTCDAGNATTPMTMVGDFYTDNLTVEAGGDADWYNVDVATGDPAVGLKLRIQTFSDMPGDPFDDDSTLWLYDACDNSATGNPADLIDFDEDGGDNFMSLIETDCLPVGSYYLRVAGWNDTSKADNIDLEIEATETCVVQIPDAFEPDDDKVDATEIGFGDAGIQKHSIFPAGDVDWVKFALAENSLVNIKTSCGFPTVFNGFMGCDAAPPAFDTDMRLWYSATNVPIAGLCNQRANANPGNTTLLSGIDNACNVDADCPDTGDLVNPFPGLPNCVPWAQFVPGTEPVNPVDNPLAFNDDSGAPGDLGSELTLCLPKTTDSPSSSVVADGSMPFYWYVDVADFGNTFDYEVKVDILGPCTYELEPNDDPASSSAGLVIDGGPVSGIFDFSASSPNGDADFWRVDVVAPAVYEFSTTGFDPVAVDTFIELIIGRRRRKLFNFGASNRGAKANREVTRRCKSSGGLGDRNP